MNEDRLVLAQILSAFRLDERLKTPRIRVAVDNGAVWLSGDVGTAEAKAAAERAARAISGVRDVINNLYVHRTWVEMLAGSVGLDGHEPADAATLELDAGGLHVQHDGKPA